MIRPLLAAVLCGLAAFASANAADDNWNKPVEPFQIYGNSYYVGVSSLSSVLVTSPQGHILLDGGYPDSPEQERCASIVFADSINPISSDGYKFSRHPEVLKQYEQSFAALGQASCDIIIAVHPDNSGTWDKLKSGKPHPLLDGGDGCKAYARQSRNNLNLRLAKEAGK